MTEAAPSAAQTSGAAAPGAAPQHPAPPQPPAEAAPKHVFEAASQQRDKVLTGFDAQRSAILKAVAEQRAAMLAPINAVRARQGVRADAPSPAAAAKAAVASEIIALIRTLVAEEVRTQLIVLLEAATLREHNKAQEQAPQ